MKNLPISPIKLKVDPLQSSTPHRENVYPDGLMLTQVHPQNLVGKKINIPQTPLKKPEKTLKILPTEILTLRIVKALQREDYLVTEKEAEIEKEIETEREIEIDLETDLVTEKVIDLETGTEIMIKTETEIEEGEVPTDEGTVPHDMVIVARVLRIDEVTIGAVLVLNVRSGHVVEAMVRLVPIKTLVLVEVGVVEAEVGTKASSHRRHQVSHRRSFTFSHDR